MSTILNTEGTTLEIPKPARGGDFRAVIITARWNAPITGALTDGAIGTLHAAGVADDRITRLQVPGTVELVNAAAAAIDALRPDAVIVIGCVIRGDTPHFDYVCQGVTQGIADINARGGVPVIFGVLTVNRLEEAQQRAGGSLGNKGAEAAVAAIEMSKLHTLLRP